MTFHTNLVNEDLEANVALAVVRLLHGLGQLLQRFGEVILQKSTFVMDKDYQQTCAAHGVVL